MESFELRRFVTHYTCTNRRGVLAARARFSLSRICGISNERRVGLLDGRANIFQHLRKFNLREVFPAEREELEVTNRRDYRSRSRVVLLLLWALSARYPK